MRESVIGRCVFGRKTGSRASRGGGIQKRLCRLWAIRSKGEQKVHPLSSNRNLSFGRIRILFNVIFQRRLEGLFGQDGAVNLHRRQSAQGVDDFLIGEVHRLFNGTALDQLRGHAGARNGRPAAKGLETGVGDSTILDFDADLHDVATGGGTDFTDAIGIFQVPHVPGIHEVFHDRGIVESVGIAHNSTLVQVGETDNSERQVNGDGEKDEVHVIGPSSGADSD